MSLEFIIIPYNEECSLYAQKVKEAIISVIPASIQINYEYDVPLARKLTKYKREGYDIITLKEADIENNTLCIRYSDINLCPEKLSIEDLQELIRGYYDKNNTADKEKKEEDEKEEDEKEEDKKEEDKKEEESEGKGCVIM